MYITMGAIVFVECVVVMGWINARLASLLPLPLRPNKRLPPSLDHSGRDHHTVHSFAHKW